jgi:glycosyltransferase involved in cell wall biosynthesis
MGFVEKPFPLFPEMDILLQPSLTTEGIPNSVLQAMAGGLAVIATPVGGLPEIIEHGVNGLLVPPGDADALATAITELASDAGRRAQLGLRAAAQVRQRHDARQAARDLLTVYQEAVAHRRGTSSSAW